MTINKVTTMTRTALLATLAAFGLASPVFAQSQGDITVGLGLAYVNPKSDTGTLDGGLETDIDSSTRPAFTVEYFIRDNIGIEVLGAWPFKNDINIDGLGKIGETKVLPPTVSLQYHFPTNGPLKPFVGAGLNYTFIYSTHSRGELGTSHLQVDNSWGVAAHVGADYWFDENRAMRADLRWIDMDADVHLNGAKIGKVNIDPLVAGLYYMMRF